MKTFNRRAVRQRLLMTVCLFLPFAAAANPVVIEPSSLLAFMVVAFWALVVEAGIVVLLLVFQGMQPLRMFLAYGATNALVFLLVFEPLLSSEKMSVPALEALVVLLDALCIKLLSSFDDLQGDDFQPLGWVRPLWISCVGNAASYFVGAIASHKPWEH
jgi:hypothetical protein